MKIKISDIKPVGNFKAPLETFDQQITEIENTVNEAGKYLPIISEKIKQIVGMGFIDSLENGIRTGEIWDVEEGKICLLYTHLLIMRLNNLANKYLNKWLEMPSDFEQLTDYINTVGGFTREVYQVK